MVLSFVIPCYRSEKTVTLVIEEIIKTVSEKNEYDYEIIAVNDCSPDNVYDVLKECAKKNKKLKVIDLAKNVGKHAALMAAFAEVQGDYVICLDDDGQCPIDYLWELIEPLNNGYDMSVAKYPKNKQAFYKNIGSKMNSMMTRVLLDKPKDFVFSNFVARKRFVCEKIIEYKNPYPYLEGISLSITRNIAFVPMEERSRISGITGYSLRKSISLWLNGFTAFSVKPLRISSFIGLICAIIGFVFGIVTIVRKFVVSNVSVGWSSTISIMLFIGGLLMLMLGMIGEYIGRIYISINNSPQYVIREKLNLK